nr:hypothetical protein CFP56_77327 [Quercus suber]
MAAVSDGDGAERITIDCITGRTKAQAQKRHSSWCGAPCCRCRRGERDMVPWERTRKGRRLWETPGGGRIGFRGSPCWLNGYSRCALNL